MKATIAYDGSAFFGSQAQKSAVSVNGKIEEALASLGIVERISASGRTDRGVHATGQVVSFKIPVTHTDLVWLKAQLNYKLFPSLRVRHLAFVPPSFHPGFAATSRLYRYLLSEAPFNPFLTRYITYAPLGDLVKVKEALRLIEGTHDFRFFYKRGGRIGTTLRTIKRARIYRHRGLWIFSFEAEGFLRSQIRLLLGSVLTVGAGEMSLEAFKKQLLGEERFCSLSVPPSGLYLCRVKY